MLICPQCEFENPNNHKFCQKCGTSLTHKNCQQCGSQVPLTNQKCHNCGADTGQIWKAIIFRQTDNQEEFITGGSPLAKDSAESAVDMITEESEDILESDLELSNSEDALESDEIVVIPDADVELVDTLPQSIAEFEDQFQNTRESDDAELTTPDADILSPMSEAANTENPSSLNYPEIISAETEQYLDAQKRYRVLGDIAETNLDTTSEVEVLDCNPLAETPLNAWLKNNSSQFQLSIPKTPDLSTYPNQQTQPPFPQKQQTGEAKEIAALIIPSIAQAYVGLYLQIPQHLPLIHDSWQIDNKEILLLADESSWPTLVELWGSENISQLQILSWLQQMTELWGKLEPWDCCQSILEPKNLRVNQAENNSIKLQRLYYDKPGETQNLQNLMQLWQSLFEQSQKTQFGWITALLQDWRDGEIQTIEQLRSYLMNTQENLQPQPSPTSPSTILQTDNSPSEKVDNIETQETELLPIQLVSLESSGKTDVGSQRDHNEDAFGIQTQIESQETSTEKIIQAKGLYILCDGMGGHASGEIASQLGVDTIKQYFQTESSWLAGLPSDTTIREAVLKANKDIYEINQQETRSGSSRMGTTLVMAMIYDTKLAIAHVGDSRLYRFSRQRGLEQITLDHEVGQREINRGVEPDIAYGRPDAYQLTQALGPRDENFVRPDIQFVEIDEDSLFILASDGLTDNQLLESYWQSHIEPLLDKQTNLESGVSKLIDLANKYNGHDNITAIVIRALVKPNSTTNN
ncbi:MAG: serine/threonine phosphatase [Trichodesmium sp.]